MSQKNCGKIKIVIIDDGSSDGTRDYIERNFPNIVVLYGDGSLFWGGAINYGVEYVKKNSKNYNDWLLIINNDAILSPNTIFELVESAKQKSSSCLVGALSVNLKDKKTILKSGTIVESWLLNKTRHIYDGLNLKELPKKEKMIKVDFLTGRCLLHPMSIFNKLDNYDSKNFPHYGADDEFSIRAINFGFDCYVCLSSIVFLDISDNQQYPLIFKRLYFILFDKNPVNIINKTINLMIVPLYAKISFYYKCFKIFLYFLAITFKKMTKSPIYPIIFLIT